jgi:hypothetical protein
VKENRFIELLNLYVDHQISAEEAAELEAEILRSPERRKTYRDYCRMQRACGMLFDRERQEAPASFALEKSLQETERKIVGRPGRRTSGWGTYTAAFAGVTAMAACLAIVLLRPGSAPVSIDGNQASAPSAPSAAVPFVVQPATPAVQTVALASRPAGFQTVFTGQNSIVARSDESTSSDRAGTDWMQQVQLPPVQRVLVDNTLFETRPTLQQDNRVFRGSHPIQGNVEFTAFQFQR